MKRTLLAFLLLLPTGAVGGDTVTVKLDNTPMLAAPTSGAETVATLPRGERLTSSGTEGGYYKVTWRGKEGYVLKFRVSAGTPISAPVIDKSVVGLKGLERVARVDEAATGHAARGFTMTLTGPEYVTMIGEKVAALDKVGGCTFTLTGAIKAEGRGEAPCAVTITEGLVATMQDEATLAGALAHAIAQADGANMTEADRRAVDTIGALGYDPTAYLSWLPADRSRPFHDIEAKGERGEGAFRKVFPATPATEKRR